MRRRTVLITAAATVAAVAAIGAGVALWVSTRADDAGQSARSYLAALERGDRDAVADLLDLDAAEEARVLDAWAQTVSRPRDARVVRLATDTDRARVEATATVDDTEHDLSFEMQRRDGRWRVTTGATTTVRVTTTLGDSVRIGDTAFAAGDVTLLPGAYDLRAAPAALVEGSASVTVPAEEALEVRVEARLTEDAVARAQDQLDAYAQECTAGGTGVPDACGLRIPWAADLATATSFAYRLEQSPVLAIANDAQTFVAGGGVVVATVTGQDHAGQDAAFTYRDDAWTLRGDLRIEDDALTLRVR